MKKITFEEDKIVYDSIKRLYTEEAFVNVKYDQEVKFIEHILITKDQNMASKFFNTDLPDILNMSPKDFELLKKISKHRILKQQAEELKKEILKDFGEYDE